MYIQFFFVRNEIPFSIRSCGHSWGDFAFKNDGIVIDMSGLNNLQVFNENNIAYLRAGSGVNMQQLYDFFIQNNQFYIPVSSCSNICLGGFAQGGGHTFWSRADGLLVDFVREVKI